MSLKTSFSFEDLCAAGVPSAVHMAGSLTDLVRLNSRDPQAEFFSKRSTCFYLPASVVPGWLYPHRRQCPILREDPFGQQVPE